MPRETSQTFVHGFLFQTEIVNPDFPGISLRLRRALSWGLRQRGEDGLLDARSPTPTYTSLGHVMGKSSDC